MFGKMHQAGMSTRQFVLGNSSNPNWYVLQDNGAAAPTLITLSTVQTGYYIVWNFLQQYGDRIYGTVASGASTANNVRMMRSNVPYNNTWEISSQLPGTNSASITGNSYSNAMNNKGEMICLWSNNDGYPVYGRHLYWWGISGAVTEVASTVDLSQSGVGVPYWNGVAFIIPLGYANTVEFGYGYSYVQVVDGIMSARINGTPTLNSTPVVSNTFKNPAVKEMSMEIESGTAQDAQSGSTVWNVWNLKTTGKLANGAPFSRTHKSYPSSAAQTDPPFWKTTNGNMFWHRGYWYAFGYNPAGAVYSCYRTDKDLTSYYTSLSDWQIVPTLGGQTLQGLVPLGGKP